MVNAILARLTVTTIAGITGVEIKTMTTNYKEGFIYFPKIEHFYKFVKPLKAQFLADIGHLNWQIPKQSEFAQINKKQQV